MVTDNVIFVIGDLDLCILDRLIVLTIVMDVPQQDVSVSNQSLAKHSYHAYTPLKVHRCKGILTHGSCLQFSLLGKTARKCLAYHLDGNWRHSGNSCNWSVCFCSKTLITKLKKRSSKVLLPRWGWSQVVVQADTLEASILQREHCLAQFYVTMVENSERWKGAYPLDKALSCSRR